MINNFQEIKFRMLKKSKLQVLKVDFEINNLVLYILYYIKLN